MAIQKITAKIIADGAIIAADVADGSITNAKIDSVANTKITGLITSTQIASVANTQLTGSIEATQVGTTVSQLFGMRNRIINGAMEIDQRNAGASFNTPIGASNTYSVDRWRIRGDTEGIMTVQQVTDAPTGFTNSLKILTQTVDSSIGSTQVYAVNQLIEGYNTADFGWGTASAKTITLSFWVKSSLTGTFGGAIKNSASNRAYPFTYTISLANTWEQKTITITGDTSGTWETTTNAGVWVNFSMGAGVDRLGTAGAWANSGVFGATGEISLISTLNATWQITGVQLEIGTTATPFERRLYNQELANCQRYYYLHVSGTAQFIGTGWMYDASNFACSVTFPVTMRTTPTLSATSGTNYYSFDRNGGTDSFNSLTITRPQTNATSMYNNTEMSGTAGHAGMTYTNSASSFIALQAEL